VIDIEIDVDVYPYDTSHACHCLRAMLQ